MVPFWNEAHLSNRTQQSHRLTILVNTIIAERCSLMKTRTRKPLLDLPGVPMLATNQNEDRASHSTDEQCRAPNGPNLIEL